MSINTDLLRKGLNIAKRGLFINILPGMLQGMLVQFLHNGKASGDITPGRIYQMVQSNDDLWSYMELPDTEKVRLLAKEAQGIDLSWLTVEWAIDAISTDHPDIASYLLSDAEAQKWLGRQLISYKQKLGLI